MDEWFLYWIWTGLEYRDIAGVLIHICVVGTLLCCWSSFGECVILCMSSKG